MRCSLRFAKLEIAFSNMTKYQEQCALFIYGDLPISVLEMLVRVDEHQETESELVEAVRFVLETKKTELVNQTK